MHKIFEEGTSVGIVTVRYPLVTLAIPPIYFLGFDWSVQTEPNRKQWKKEKKKP